MFCCAANPSMRESRDAGERTGRAARFFAARFWWSKRSKTGCEKALKLYDRPMEKIAAESVALVDRLIQIRERQIMVAESRAGAGGLTRDTRSR